MKIILSLLFLIIAHFSRGQDYTWWNVKHHWDGSTPWSDYIILSPAFMGPHALPVPEIKTGNMPVKAEFEFSAEKYFSQGDKTENLFLKLFLPINNSPVGLNLSIVPVEHYQMDTMTRDRRCTRDYDGGGFSSGDLYIGTYIQISRENAKWPDILLTINLKTASGDNLLAARFTDSPAYFFDMSFGEEFMITNSFIQSFTPYAMAGLYVWQNHTDDHFQNDAFLYGLGLQVRAVKFECKNELGGYLGYLGNGDHPMVYRLHLESMFSTYFNYIFMFQQGLHDFPYSSFKLGCVMDLGIFKGKKNI